MKLQFLPLQSRSLSMVVMKQFSGLITTIVRLDACEGAE
jgi:hypothetical protein